MTIEPSVARRGRPNSKEKILEAAERLVAEVGVARLTFEALSERASVSRGGILYNFPSKEALVAAMVERLVARLYRVEAEERARGLGPIGVYIAAGLRSEGEERALSSALLTAVVNDPALLAPIRDIYRRELTGFLAQEDGADAAILALAADALSLLDVLGLSPLDPGQRARVADRLMALAERHDAAASAQSASSGS